MKAIVMVPTYNERGNITRLLKEILQNKDVGVVVVDDDSPDLTWQVAQNWHRRYPSRVFLIRRIEQRGRGTAGVAGLKFAIGKKVEYILEMDADFSHNPAYIPQFLKKIGDADVVIGSRFVKGGKDADRGLVRKAISKTSRIAYRLITGLPIADLGSGYKCYRRTALSTIDLDHFISTGLAVGMETIFKLWKGNFKVIEIPIVFADRKIGYSKLRARDFIEPVVVGLKLVARYGRA